MKDDAWREAMKLLDPEVLKASPALVDKDEADELAQITVAGLAILSMPGADLYELVMTDGEVAESVKAWAELVFQRWKSPEDCREALGDEATIALSEALWRAVVVTNAVYGRKVGVH
jgi:hypothetical protein